MVAIRPIVGDEEVRFDSTSLETGILEPVNNMIVDFDDGDWSNIPDLTRMMNRTTRKLDSISLWNVDRVSPAFLALLIALSNKTSRIRLCGCFWIDHLYTCLMGPIMNGLVELGICCQYDEEEEISIPSDFLIKLLFEAVGSSSSLERFVFCCFELDLEDELCIVLLETLRRNRRLRTLSLKVDYCSMPQEIFRAALLETELERLILRIAGGGGNEFMPLSILIEGLCRADCTLKELTPGFRFNWDIDLNSLSSHNTSLVELDLRNSNFTCEKAVKVAKACKSLQILDISANPISDLTPLDEILLGEETTLKRLHMNVIRRISEEKWIKFFGKIHRMKVLERLKITCAPFVEYSDSLKAAFLDALWKNNSLEAIWIDGEYTKPGEKLHKSLFALKVALPVCLNRAGRKALQNESSEQLLPKALWPIMLERAMNLKYYSTRKSWGIKGSPNLTSTRTDAVYWLLREHPNVLVV